MNMLSAQPFNKDQEISIFSIDEIESKNQNQLVRFTFDPLAFVLALIDHNYSLVTIYSIFQSESTVETAIIDKVKCYQDHSDQIKKYYKNKLLLTRLKKSSLSKYSTRLEKILENIHELQSSDIPILLKLPDFYRQDTETESLIKKYSSVEIESSYPKPAFEHTDQYQFAGKVSRNGKKEKIIRYYFSNQKNQLMVIKIVQDTVSTKLMDYIIKQNKTLNFHVRGNIREQPGHLGFLMFHATSFEIV